ncbi:hypothetical protein PHPALM_30453 [Phytophthora palmivora]|uniref:Uncharacterized protein n=1 Tax=Phytophthora palmivora TaxID=4796 RepID=A0A2P4X532_9STRA|nr:hypothetical protein PHPALM_30453 [Phytophthora palmivora]
MQYLAARAPIETFDPFYRRWMLNATSWFVAIRGDLSALQWLMEIYLPDEMLSAAVYAAAANGHVEILEWLYTFHHERIYWNGIEMCGALDYGHDNAMQWLRTHSRPRPECLKLVMRSAAKTGNLEVVRWLYNECHAPAEDALRYAQKEGYWETARWILVNCELEVRRVNWDGAAADGALSFIKYAYSRGLGKPRSSTLVAAASNGHLEIVTWLYDEVHLPLIAGAMRRAAENGHLSVVQRLHDKDCEQGDVWTMDSAAKNGHLDVVEWLHEYRNEGCSSKTMSWAAGHGHLEVVKWLHTHRSEGCTKLAMDMAATNGYLEIVQWLHENRTEGCSTDAMDGAARSGHLHVVQWLHANRAEGCTTSAMDASAAASLKGTITSNATKGLKLERRRGDKALELEVLIKLGVADCMLDAKYIFPMTLVTRQNAPPSEQVDVLTAQVQSLQQEVKTLKEQMKAVLHTLEKSVVSSLTSPGFTIRGLPTGNRSSTPGSTSPTTPTTGNEEISPTRDTAEIPSRRDTAEIHPTPTSRKRQTSEIADFTDHKLAKHKEYREKITSSGAIERKNRQHNCKVCSALRGDRRQPFRTYHYCVECTKKREGGMVFLCNKVRPHDAEEYRNATCNQIWHALWNNGEDMPASGVTIRMRKKLKASEPNEVQ